VRNLKPAFGEKPEFMGQNLTITWFGTTKGEIPNFHVGFIAEICNPQILAQNPSNHIEF
jgi:hypothetical protein